MQKIVKYDTNKHRFRSLIEDIFQTTDLEHLHSRKSYDVFERFNDQTTVYHETFYNSIHSGHKFIDMYEDFISDFVLDTLGLTEVVYQKIPTFRCHLCKNKAVGEFHKDSDYNHPKSEINFFVPVTDAIDTSTIWIETKPDKRDFRPINLKYGEIFIFNGGVYNHGNKLNETGKTRVGFDFRVIRPSEYTESDKTSLNVTRKFAIGGYYEKM